MSFRQQWCCVFIYGSGRLVIDSSHFIETRGSEPEEYSVRENLYTTTKYMTMKPHKKTTAINSMRLRRPEALILLFSMVRREICGVFEIREWDEEGWGKKVDKFYVESWWIIWIAHAMYEFWIRRRNYRIDVSMLRISIFQQYSKTNDILYFDMKTQIKKPLPPNLEAVAYIVVWHRPSQD